MAQFHSMGLVTSKLTYNGKEDLTQIYKEMQKSFDAVGASYKSKTNRSLTDIRFALRKANEVMYGEAFRRAPTITAKSFASESPERKNIHIKDRRYMIERSAHGKKWTAKGIVARRVVTFKDPVSEYAAALEFGRDEFMQVVRKAPYGINGGDTDFWLRKVGAMKAQPFLLPAQRAAASRAYATFGKVLQKRWLATLKRVNKKRQ